MNGIRDDGNTNTVGIQLTNVLYSNTVYYAFKEQTKMDKNYENITEY
jgi:hypothetical protein